MAFLTNYHGANLYDVAKVLYAALPDYLCGNDKKEEEKIRLCFNGNSLCISQSAAEGFLKKGAYLGDCDQSSNPKKQDGVINENTITAFPNPFSSTVSFSFKAKEAGSVSLKIYDLNGKMVESLYSGQTEKKALHQINFDGSKLPAGIYISRLQTASGVTEQKIVKTR